MILVPPKIRWMVDLGQDIEERWRGKALKRILSPHYAEGLVWELEPSSRLALDLLPIYQEHIMNRSTFRLDKCETLQKMAAIGRDLAYQIFVVRDRATRIILGGVVFHTTKELIGIAYRVYDHGLAKSLGYQKIDYYGEKCFQDYVKSLGYRWLSHGSDRHPIIQPGLSLFKLSIGARPIVYVGEVEVSPVEVSENEWGARYETWGYYSMPSNNGYYQKLSMQGHCESECVVALIKVAQQVGLTVECNTI